MNRLESIRVRRYWRYVVHGTGGGPEDLDALGEALQPLLAEDAG